MECLLQLSGPYIPLLNMGLTVTPSSLQLVTDPINYVVSRPKTMQTMGQGVQIQGKAVKRNYSHIR